MNEKQNAEQSQEAQAAGSELKGSVRLGTITDIQRRFFLSYGQAKEIHDAIAGAAQVERERIIALFADGISLPAGTVPGSMQVVRIFDGHLRALLTRA